jgi:hypothetical protein
MSVGPGGVRPFLSESWGTLQLMLQNPNAQARDARLLVFFAGRPDVQYGRDVWVPARSTLTTWMLIGPAEPQAEPHSRELQVLLYDRTGGQNRLVLPPGEQRVRGSAGTYRRREPVTCVMTDLGPEGDDAPPGSDAAAEEVRQLARTFRSAANLSEHVQTLYERFLPPTADAFQGVDHFVLADRRLGNDPAGQLVLRRWVQRGGKLWVMLDLADADTVGDLLGDGPSFQVVDRTSLTTVRIHSLVSNRVGAEVPMQELEQPVDLIRVVPAPEDRVLHTVDGWPASFTRQVGRGKVLFTTLGARGWFRPRTAIDGPSPYEGFRDLPVALFPLEQLAQELQPDPDPHPFGVDAFGPLLSDEIGYSIMGVGTAALIFGAFVAVLLALGMWLRRSRRPELVGWLAPAAAVAAAATFFALGEASRRSVPPKVAVVQMVEAVPAGREQPVSGLLAIYRPDGGPATVASAQGGLLDLDMRGLEGQTRRLVVTDTDAWHWEDLALPAGVRLAPFQYTTRKGEPVGAVARFGRDGIEGKLAAGPFQGLADALISTPTRRPLAVRLRPDGTFTAAERLPPGQYLSAAVLSDRQQRRQEVYRQLLAEEGPSHLEDRTVLLAWAEPVELPFTLEPGAQTAGSALLAVPLEFERGPPGTRFTIPSPLIRCRRMLQGGLGRLSLQGKFEADMDLRFELPRGLLPLKVERARLFLKINARGRRVTVSGQADEGRVKLLVVEGPTEPIRLDITRADLLRPDGQGRLRLNFAVSDLLPARADGQRAAGDDSSWTIDVPELELTCQAAAAE